jgi:hypothetical protein
MKDKRLEANIKKAKDFLEIWKKFHNVFRNVFSGNTINKKEERHFLSTRELVNSRYDDLMDSLGVKPIRRFITGEAVYSILSIEDLSVMSDEKLHMVERNWEESFTFLRSLLERLERKKRRIGGFNTVAFAVKKRFNSTVRRRSS